jgi:lysophospholipase L1-like esterase
VSHPRIAFLGDSLTEGWPGASYFALLRVALPELELLNLGRAGDTVADLETRILRRGMPPADLAFVWIGVNDAFMGTPRPEALRASLARLLDTVQEHAAACVCVLPLLPDDDPGGLARAGEAAGDLDPFGGAAAGVAAVAAVGAEQAAARSLRVLDLRPHFAAARARDPRAVFTIDGVHLSDAGATVVAETFRREMAALSG